MFFKNPLNNESARVEYRQKYLQVSVGLYFCRYFINKCLQLKILKLPTSLQLQISEYQDSLFMRAINKMCLQKYRCIPIRSLLDSQILISLLLSLSLYPYFWVIPIVITQKYWFISIFFRYSWPTQRRAERNGVKRLSANC